MLKLAENFYMSSIWVREKNGLNLKKDYNFIYKNYNIILQIDFCMLAVTRKSNIAIVNFGYSVDVRKWSNRHLRYVYVDDLDEQDGRSTKKYFDDKTAREIVVRTLEKNMSNYLIKVKPCILIRGAFSDIKASLPRYKRFDKIFFENNYQKTELNTKDYESLHKVTLNKNDETCKLIWAYAKDNKNLLELRDVY